jgi:hypothetical protein
MKGVAVMATNNRRRREAAGEKMDTRILGERRALAGLIAVAATALAGAAVLFLFTTRTGREARARLQDGDLGRRLQETTEELQRLAEHGAAYVERKAAEIRQAIGARANMLDMGTQKGE